MRKIFILMLCVIFLAGIANAELFKFDNAKQYNPTTQTISIVNTFGIGADIADIKLNTPLEYKVGVGYQKVAEFQVKNYEDYNNVLENMKFTNLKTNKEINRQFDYMVKSYETVKVDDYAPCIEKDIHKCVESKVIGTHEEQREVWTKLDNSDFKAGDILTIGVFTNTQEGDKVEWVVNAYGKDITEWANWSASLYNGLMVYYSFESPTLAIDNRSNTNGSFDGSIVSGISCKVGNCINFTTAGDKVGMGLFSSTTQTYTWASWVYLYGFTPSTDMGYFDTGVGRIAIEANTGGTLKVYDGSAFRDSGAHLSGDKWIFLIVAINSSGLFVYQNGVYNSSTATITLRNIGGGSNFGDVAGAAYIGLLDETGIWNRSLTQAEINNLYNGGAGIAYGATEPIVVTPAVTLNSPINYYNSTNSLITFNINATDAQEITNVSLFIDGVLNQTNTSQVNGTYIFTKTLSQGAHNWSILSYNNNSNSNQSETRNLNIDSIKPILYAYAPTGAILTTTLPYNTTINISSQDTNLDKCWYYTSDDATNRMYTCNALFYNNFTTAGIKIIYLFANDTFGNTNDIQTLFSLNFYNYSITYKPTVIEGDTRNIFFNLSATSITTASANISYDGVNYTMLTVSGANSTNVNFIKTINIPLVSSDTNKYFTVYYVLDNNNFSSSNKTQLIYNIPAPVISTSCDDKAIKFNLLDETNLTVLNGTFQYNFKYGPHLNNTFTQSYGLINNTNVFYLCVNSTISPTWELGEGEIAYNSPGYADRRYYLFNGTTLTASTQNITLYDLLNSDQTSFKLEVESSSLSPYINKYTTLIRWYPDLNQYNVVDMGQTDETGSTVIHVRTEDVDYRIGVYEKDGTLIKLAEPIRMVCLLSPCTYTLKVLPTDIDYTSLLGIDYNFDYNKTTGIWLFTFVDSSQKTSTINLTVYKQTGTSVYPVCSNIVTGYTGAVSCNTSIYSGTLEGIVLRSASPPVPLASKVVNTETNSFSSGFGLFLTFLIILPIVFIFAFVSPLGAVIGGVISLIPALYFGAVNWAIVGGIAVLAGIIIHFLKRTN